MPRYFFGENAGRPIRAGGEAFPFEIVSLSGGTQQGVVAVPDAQVDLFLSVARGLGVEEITAEDYAAYLQKKKSSRRLPPLDSARPERPGLPRKGAGAVEREGLGKRHALAGGAATTLPEKLDDLITVGTADRVPDMAPAKKTTKRENHRAKRGFE